MPKILILNGPPRSGKDTIAKILPDFFDMGTVMVIEKFAKPLKDAVRAFYGIPLEDWGILDSPELKDIPSEGFLGKTPREVQIAMSEVYAKPIHSNRVFGELLAARMEDASWVDWFIITDGGFNQEVEALVQGFGLENIKLVHLQRNGITFEGDSRNYINVPGLEPRCIDNSGDLHETVGEVAKFMKEG